MKLPSLIAVPLLLAAAGCSPQPSLDLSDLRGRPSWLALGREVYQERDDLDAEKTLLAFQPEPRWFDHGHRLMTKAQYDAFRASPQGRSAEGTKWEAASPQTGEKHAVPTPQPYPKSLSDLPLDDRGVRLSLAIEPDKDPRQLRVRLILTSEALSVHREVEHRRTNILPFLFAVYVDGKAVAVDPATIAEMGGLAEYVDLARPGAPRVWSVAADASSLLALLPDKGPHTVSIVAAFSSRQHRTYAEGWQYASKGMTTSGQPYDFQPLLVRSHPAGLRWTGTAWQTPRTP
ncbi:MAG: hypothetical protein NTV86_03115 [Planctomycetota bacterium]|nr:hypothetical protein [Planctomycetota bacterium]